MRGIISEVSDLRTNKDVYRDSAPLQQETLGANTGIKEIVILRLKAVKCYQSITKPASGPISEAENFSGSSHVNPCNKKETRIIRIN